nr:restriction endonuclease subunit S [uncultured Prevotella sp.]
MKYIDELLQGEKVEWLPIGSITKYEQPTNYLVKSTNYHKSYATPVLTAGKTFILGYTNEVNGIYKASKTPVIIFDDFTTANKWVDFDFKAKSSAMKMITSQDESKVLLKYIYYWLNTLPTDIVEGDHKRQWISSFCSKKIPIPCPSKPEKSLEIQRKIVDILDKFTTLEAELEAELDCRKRQYEYYRNQLLSFKDGSVIWKSLGAVIKPTVNIKWSKAKQVYRYIDLTSVNIETRTIFATEEITSETAPSRAKKIVLANDVIFATTRPTQMRITVVPCEYNNQVASTGYCVLRADDKQVLSKWIYFLLSTNKFRTFLEDNQSGTAYPAISDSKLKEFQIPVPPLSEQERIVSILDKFDTLVNSISEGLPKEIELRRKQYEYYRERLLSFRH